MSTGRKCRMFAGVAVLCAAVLFLGRVNAANAETSHGQRKARLAPPARRQEWRFEGSASLFFWLRFVR